MEHQAPRGIVVVDAGATNLKVSLFDGALTEQAVRTQPIILRDDGPYRYIDPEPVVGFARECIAGFDGRLAVDAIVACTHGSALALLDGQGGLALPIMSYLQAVPEDIAAAYGAMTPPFDEVFAPTNPGALTLGRQLLWQEMHFADAFARAVTILPYAQYLACRLSGIAASEISSLGAQTHLWAPLENGFSRFAVECGWADRFAATRPAWQRLGPVAGLVLNGRGTVLTGIHDSNANYLRYQGEGGFVLLSTGTWIIGFDSTAPVGGLDGARDQVANTTVFGDAVACCRFMGGGEFGTLADGADPAEATPDALRRLIEGGVFALPSFSDSGGPVPGSGGKGRIVGAGRLGRAERASIAALYTAQMTALALDRLGAGRRVIVEG